MKVWERSLGKVSVVQMAVAAESQDRWVDERALCARGILDRIFLIGSRCPMTPVLMTIVFPASEVSS